MNLENSTLKQEVKPSSPMKSWLVDYVGENFKSEIARAEAETMKTLEWDGTVTVEMIVELMTKEFPDFVMAVAEENFIRGYRQAMGDVQIDIVGREE
jgi:hypothetical protein